MGGLLEPIMVISALAGTPADPAILSCWLHPALTSPMRRWPSNGSCSELLGIAAARWTTPLNGAFILAITQAICAYRQKEDKQLFRGRLWSQCESADG